MSRYTYIDETMGPFNDGSGYPVFYFVYRKWTDLTAHQQDKVDGESW